MDAVEICHLLRLPTSKIPCMRGRKLRLYRELGECANVGFQVYRNQNILLSDLSVSMQEKGFGETYSVLREPSPNL